MQKKYWVLLSLLIMILGGAIYQTNLIKRSSISDSKQTVPNMNLEQTTEPLILNNEPTLSISPATLEQNPAVDMIENQHHHIAAEHPIDLSKLIVDAKPNCSCSDIPKGYHIVFDVGDVLLNSSSTAAAKAVGVSHMFWYTVKHKKTPESKDIQARLFEFIDYCTQQPRGHALFNGQQLPAIMCEWAKGKLNTDQILKIVTHYEKQAQAFFKSEEEKNLVFGAMNLFKPDVISNIQKPITKMVQLYTQCCEDFPNNVYILSNWDRESADLIYKKFPEIFNKIPASHVLFSGHIGEIKPQAEAFNYLTNKFQLDPKRCILIDDNSENVKVARSLGWKAILHKQPERTARKLKRLTN